MLNKIKEAINEIGYTSENIENPVKGRVTFFIIGDFDPTDMECQMDEMIKDMHYVCLYNIENAGSEKFYEPGAYVTFEEIEKKTFGELKVGDTFYKQTGLSFSHHVVLRNIVSGGLSDITFKDVRVLVNRESFLDDVESQFPYYASLEKLESDLTNSLKLVKSMKELV